MSQPRSEKCARARAQAPVCAAVKRRQKLSDDSDAWSPSKEAMCDPLARSQVCTRWTPRFGRSSDHNGFSATSSYAPSGYFLRRALSRCCCVRSPRCGLSRRPSVWRLSVWPGGARRSQRSVSSCRLPPTSMRPRATSVVECRDAATSVGVRVRAAAADQVPAPAHRARHNSRVGDWRCAAISEQPGANGLWQWALLPRAVAGMIALICGNVYIVGINQIYDVEMTR